MKQICTTHSSRWDTRGDDSLILSAVAKTKLGPEKTCLRRERDNYNLPAVTSCQYIRTLYDVVGQDVDAVQNSGTAADDALCLVFKWMEHELQTVPSDEFRQNSNLPKIIARSVLSALALLKTEYNAVHTGESPPFYNLQRLRMTRRQPQQCLPIRRQFDFSDSQARGPG